jgi:hypothetical protein
MIMSEEGVFMKSQTEAECLDEVRAVLQRQRDRHEEFMSVAKGSPEPDWV